MIDVFTNGSVQIHPANGSLSSMRDIEFIESLCDNFMALAEAVDKPLGEFAKSVGLTPQQMSNIAKRRNPPSHKVLSNAARLYGLTTDFFYYGILGGMRDETIADRLRTISRRKVQH